MIQVRRSAERGHFNHGWLDTYHTFSFADYHDPAHMGFRALRVLNEDRVAPGRGFGTHPHRDMEIVTYILAGALEHKDSMGHGEVLRPGELQRITAGTGITHSEFNPSPSEPVHLLQIWLIPDRRGHTPEYEQRPLPEAHGTSPLRLAASPNGERGSLKIHQDVRLYIASLEAGATLAQPLEAGRFAWLQVARGSLELNGQTLAAGDGAAISEERLLNLRGIEPAELLLFDLN